ncbi:deoxyribonuclease IV [Aquibacillus rhizosphaerae]|uniref:deoxyribonuclease IV n=1 Tax=Aquibacillus rhizosphaerae TaxID=3051431 RepID=UPI002F42D587
MQKYCENNQLTSVSHSPYPTNLTTLIEKRPQVIESLLNDLDISETCGSFGVVVHFGKETKTINPLHSYQLIIETLNEVLVSWKGSCKILLENNAGKPGSIGTTLEELVQIRKLTDAPEKIGFCFDTCHAYASGLWNGENWNELCLKGEELNYFKHLECIHFNNSKYPTGEGKDRHANIVGNGHITKRQWEEFLSSNVNKGIPLILETPDEIISHKEEIAQIKQVWEDNPLI